jgi:hypothetical protein
MHRYLTALSILLLAGCGGAQPSTEAHGHHAGGEHHHHGGEGHHHAHDFPPAVDAFHDVLAPAWHSAPGETRRAAGCAAVPTLRERVGPIAAEVPEGVDAAAWSSAASTLASSIETLAQACESAPDTAETRFSELHDAFHALIEQLGHEH